MWVLSLGWEDPLEEEMSTHSSILAWRISWTEEPGGLWSVASQRVRHNWSDLARHSLNLRENEDTWGLLKLKEWENPEIGEVLIIHSPGGTGGQKDSLCQHISGGMGWRNERLKPWRRGDLKTQTSWATTIARKPCSARQGEKPCEPIIKWDSVRGIKPLRNEWKWVKSLGWEDPPE